MIKATISEVQGVVAAVHGLTREHMKCANRKQRYARARQEAMYLARELTTHSLPSIGHHFGGRDHTTVLYGIRHVALRAAADEKLAARLEQCRRAIAALVAERAAALGLPAGSSTEWSPPPPLQIAKPDRIRAAIDFASWQAIGGEMEAAA